MHNAYNYIQYEYRLSKMKILTKNKAELLGLFFTNPEKSFYIQEIGRIFGKKPGTFQRTLNNLISEGILRSEYKGNLRFIKVNKEYPIYEELKSIIFKTAGVKGNIKKVLEKIGSIKLAFIYGSYAKSRENLLSDVDLLIVGNPDEDKLITELDKLEEKLQRDINYKIYRYDEFRKVIIEKDPFILEILKEKKIMLVGNKNDL